MNIYFYLYLNIPHDVVTVFLLFVDIQFDQKISHAHIEARTQKHTKAHNSTQQHTCMISAQEEW